MPIRHTGEGGGVRQAITGRVPVDLGEEKAGERWWEVLNLRKKKETARSFVPA